MLQEREFERVGGNDPVRVDVRVIAATNRDIAEDVAKGRFRADLYYRLNVFPIMAPPPRSRREDVPTLAKNFLEQANRRLHKTIGGLSYDALGALVDYEWPGNVRELQNVIERAAILTDGEMIERSALPVLKVRDQTKANSSRHRRLSRTSRSGHHVERDHVLSVLESTRWVVDGKAGAAARLGLRPSTLRSRMGKLGIRRAK